MDILLSMLLSLTCIQADSFQLQSGDLIFQEGCAGNVSDAIKGVTSSVDSYQFTHVGMVYIDSDNNILVLEATHPQVRLTPLSDYLHPRNECQPRSVVARLKPVYRTCLNKALQEGISLIGKEYDYVYNLANDSYYCSELIYHILLKANNNRAIFPLNAMTFKDPQSGLFLPQWVDYFAKHGADIPEGEPGINPGAMSRSDVIDIIHYY